MKPSPNELNIRFGKFIVEARGSEAIRSIKVPVGVFIVSLAFVIILVSSIASNLNFAHFWGFKF